MEKRFDFDVREKWGYIILYYNVHLSRLNKLLRNPVKNVRYPNLNTRNTRHLNNIRRIFLRTSI